MSHWSEEEIEFYNRRGFPIERDYMRKEIWEALKGNVDESYHKEVRELF